MYKRNLYEYDNIYTLFFKCASLILIESLL